MSISRRILTLILSTSLAAPSLGAQPIRLYQFDVTHGTLEFGVRLVGFNRVRGTFGVQRGDVLVTPDDTLRSVISFAVDAASISTGNQERDGHLRSGDFFDAERWPAVSFTSHRMERGPDGGLVAVGPLTIRDMTREVRIPFSIVSAEGVDPFGNVRFAVAGSFTVNRRDFGVVGPAFWNRAISDSVEIAFEMPGRRWNFESMSLGSAGRRSAPQRVIDDLPKSRLDRAIAQGWEDYLANGKDSTVTFGWFEFLKAAGKLTSQGRRAESIAVLDLGARIAEADGRGPGAASLRAAIAEAHLVGGNARQAREEVSRALTLDPRNTTALVLQRYFSAASP